MNTLTIVMLGLVLLGLNVAFIALAVQLGTGKIRDLLTELVALQMAIRQQQLQQQVHDSIKRGAVPPNAETSA